MLKTERNSGTPNSSPSAEYVIVRCSCGETMEGSREHDFQSLVCPNCSASVFVLGTSPRAPVRPRVLKPIRPPEAPTTETLPPSPKRKHTKRARRRLRTRRWRQRWKTWFGLKSWITLPLVIFLVVFVVAGFTLARNWKLAAQNRRKETVAAAAQAGFDALEKGQFPLAARHFGEILNQHVNVDHDDTSPEVLNVSREVTAVAEILADSLDRALSFVAADPNSRNDFIRGKGVLLDAVISPTARGTFEVASYLAANNEPVRIAIGDAAVFHRLKISEPTRFLLAVRLRQLTRDDVGWTLEIDPDSVALVTQPSLLTYLGFERDLELSDLVHRQNAQIKSLTPEGP